MKLPRKVFLQQKVEVWEAVTGIERCNKYKVLDENKKELMVAYETRQYRLRRIFMSGMRPLNLIIDDLNGKRVMSIYRPTTFMRGHYTVKNPEGEAVASIEQKFGLFKRKFIIKLLDGKQYKVLSKGFKIWTYDILDHDRKIASILKKWSGLMKEAFTDADTFLIDFENIKDDDLKKVIVAIAFAIDMTFFEGNAGRKSR